MFVTRCIEFIIELERWHFQNTKSLNTYDSQDSAVNIRQLIAANIKSKRHQNTEPISARATAKCLDEFLVQIDS